MSRDINTRLMDWWATGTQTHWFVSLTIFALTFIFTHSFDCIGCANSLMQNTYTKIITLLTVISILWIADYTHVLDVDVCWISAWNNSVVWVGYECFLSHFSVTREHYIWLWHIFLFCEFVSQFLLIPILDHEKYANRSKCHREQLSIVQVFRSIVSQCSLHQLRWTNTNGIKSSSACCTEYSANHVYRLDIPELYTPFWYRNCI